MSLFIQNDSGSFGAGSVFPDRAFSDLLQIAKMDVGLGEGTATGDLLPVTYSQTLFGNPPNRLNTLVNTDFIGVPGPVDIIIIATDATFTLSDGTVLTNYGGLTFPLGNPENPTASVVVLYDTSQAGGGGYCLKGEASGKYDLQTPNPVLLYHELSHAFRDATNSSLSRTASGCAASPEEHAAEVDENDMRDQLGTPHRDTTDHCGNPGCPSPPCCIVASIATGSAFSQEVNQLRRFRDSFLRVSDVGFDFFQHLHRDYYGFSPEVCRVMGCAPDIRELIRCYFVLPLVQVLGLAVEYAQKGADAHRLGLMFEEGLVTEESLASLSGSELGVARALLNSGLAAPAALEGRTAELGAIIGGRATTSPFVHWALIETIKIYVDAVEWHIQGTSADEIGKRLAESFDEWGARFPLTDIWKTLSKYATGQELDFLKQTLLPQPGARSVFARRLSEFLGRSSELDRVLDEAAYNA